MTSRKNIRSISLLFLLSFFSSFLKVSILYGLDRRNFARDLISAATLLSLFSSSLLFFHFVGKRVDRALAFFPPSLTTSDHLPSALSPIRDRQFVRPEVGGISENGEAPAAVAAPPPVVVVDAVVVAVVLVWLRLRGGRGGYAEADLRVDNLPGD